MTQGFDEWYDNNEHYHKYDACKSAYKAGAQSRQAEIDELHLKYSRDSQALHNVIEMEVNKRDELQKRIDDAVNCMEQNKPSFPMDFKHAMDALSILKGKQND